MKQGWVQCYTEEYAALARQLQFTFLAFGSTWFNVYDVVAVVHLRNILQRQHLVC